MKTKDYKIDVRLSKEEYDKLIYLSEKAGVSKSKYMRQALNDKMNGRSMDCVESLCRLSTICTRIIDKYEIKPEEKAELVRGVEYAWQQL